LFYKGRVKGTDFTRDSLRLFCTFEYNTQIYLSTLFLLTWKCLGERAMRVVWRLRHLAAHLVRKILPRAEDESCLLITTNPLFRNSIIPMHKPTSASRILTNRKCPVEPRSLKVKVDVRVLDANNESSLTACGRSFHRDAHCYWTEFAVCTRETRGIRCIERTQQLFSEDTQLSCSLWIAHFMAEHNTTVWLWRCFRVAIVKLAWLILTNKTLHQTVTTLLVICYYADLLNYLKLISINKLETFGIAAIFWW